MGSQSAARGFFLLLRLTARFNRTTAGSIAPAEQCVYNGSSAPHPCLHDYCLRRTIPAACPALHAGVPVFNPCAVLAIHGNNTMGANLDTHAAADAFFLMEGEGYYVFEIGHSSHFKTPMQ